MLPSERRIRPTPALCRPAPALRHEPPPPLVRVREFSAADFADVRYISTCVRHRLPAGFPSPVRGLMGGGGFSSCIVGELYGRVVGYAIFDPHPEGPELLDVGVEPFVRRKTVGTHLLRYLRNRLAPGDSIVTTFPEACLGDLAPFLAQQGFVTVPGPDGRHMRLGRFLKMRFAADGPDTGCERGVG